MSRIHSIAYSDASKGEKSSTSQVEDAGQLADLEAVCSRHVVIGTENSTYEATREIGY